jgi:hypothetical protein
MNWLAFGEMVVLSLNEERMGVCGGGRGGEEEVELIYRIRRREGSKLAIIFLPQHLSR